MKIEDVYLWLWSISGIGSKTIERLQESADLNNIFAMSDKDIYNIEGINMKVKEQLIKYKKKSYIDDIKESLYKKKVNFVTVIDEMYPTKLKNIYDPPSVLYYKGDINILNDMSIGIVGSRSPTDYGISCAKKLSKSLSNYKINVVSGLAIGIDSYAHMGCIEGKAKTIAVLGSSVDNIYPNQNKRLSNQILDDGGVILSEYNLGHSVNPNNFPRRNRLISGLSDGIVVVEAATKSGALITVDFALEQGKNVFAIPGLVSSEKSRGCHKIIKEGAKLIECLDDILNEYSNINFKIDDKIEKCDNIDLKEEEKNIVDILKKYGNLYIDSICDYAKMDMKDTIVILNNLEIKGIVTEIKNKIYSI